MSSSAAKAPRMNIRQSLALVWRTLRSMRTALVLLLVLAMGAVAGSLVPQAGTSDARIAAMFRDHPLRARIYNQLGLFDVFGSWWFTLIYTLLLVSLVACLIPRTRAMIRNLRSRPQPARELDSMRHYAERSVRAEPDRVISGARRVLRRRLFRVNGSNGSGPPSLAADKGLAREGGSLLFHWAFLLILVGIVWGKGTGFSGLAVIVEGQTWTEAHANYDGQIHEGRFFREDHSGVQIHVDSFTARYRIPSGIPEDFVTHAELYDAEGRYVKTADIRVNHPVEVEGVKFYQFGYGWAPVIDVRRDGEPLASGPVVCQQDPTPKGVSPLQLPWNCVVKLPTLRPQVGIQFRLWPDSRALFALLDKGQAMPMITEFAPVMTYTAYRGDLRAELTQSISQLDTSAMQPFKDGVIGAGDRVKLGNGVTVSFPDLKQYTVLEVKRDRGLWIELLAAILILIGLLPALYTSRRKVWVIAEPDGTGSRLRVGGFALQRRSQFEEEFAKLVDELSEPFGEKVNAP
ncbi:MAG TPA: cytochrome c biogenesis protein ResB [Actinomycetota bacterium]